MKAGVTKTHSGNPTSGSTLIPRVIPETVGTSAQIVGFWPHRTRKRIPKHSFSKQAAAQPKQKSLPWQHGRLCSDFLTGRGQCGDQKVWRTPMS
jgi:hypothetical protein